MHQTISRAQISRRAGSFDRRPSRVGSKKPRAFQKGKFAGADVVRSGGVRGEIFRLGLNRRVSVAKRVSGSSGDHDLIKIIAAGFC